MTDWWGVKVGGVEEECKDKGVCVSCIHTRRTKTRLRVKGR